MVSDSKITGMSMSQGDVIKLYKKINKNTQVVAHPGCGSIDVCRKHLTSQLSLFFLFSVMLAVKPPHITAGVRSLTLRCWINFAPY